MNPWRNQRRDEWGDLDGQIPREALKEMSRQNGAEILRQGGFSGEDPAMTKNDILEMTKALLAEKGLKTGDVDVRLDRVPGYVYKEVVPLNVGDRDEGITFLRSFHYPSDRPNKATSGVSTFYRGGVPRASEQIMSTMDHELEHAKDGPNALIGQHGDNKNPHFNSDEPGQMLNYEGKAALQRMIKRLLGSQPKTGESTANPWAISDNY